MNIKSILVAIMLVALGLGSGAGIVSVWYEMKRESTPMPKPTNRGEVPVGEGKYPLLDPMRSVRPQEDFVVVMKPLRLKLEELVAEWHRRGVVVSIQIEYLNSGTHLSINQNYRMLPASLTKVPVAMMVMHRVEEGLLNLDQQLEITEADRDSKWGELYKASVGTKLTLKETLEKSLIESDNTAHKMLYRLVGIEDAQVLSEGLNLEDLFDNSGKITAREYARLLRSLYTSSYLEPENSSWLLELLTQDQVVKFLIRGLGQDVKYAHKFGESVAVRSYLDAGIVYAPWRPFIIVVMVHDEAGEVGLTREVVGTEIFQPVAQLTYDYLTKANSQ